MTTRRRIILHWTAGTYTPNAKELKHYHRLIGLDKSGKAYIQKGLCSFEDNDNCYDGRYAAHCGGGNTRSIGYALCGMLGFVSKYNPGDYPITRKQFELACFEMAQTLKAEGHSSVTPENLFTHHEFGLLNPKTSSAGKIDIIYLPPFPNLAPEEIGHFIRRKVGWYLERVKKSAVS